MARPVITAAGTAAAVAAATSQQAQRQALAAPWAGGDVTVRLFAGATQLCVMTYGPHADDAGNPPGLVLGPLTAYTHTAAGTATRAVYRTATADIYEYTVSGRGGGGDIEFDDPVVQVGRRMNLADAVLPKVRTLGASGLPLTPPASATTVTLTGSTTGTTGNPTTFTATLNGPVQSGGGTVSITAPGATLSTATLTFAFGGATAQTFTVTRATDGTSSVSITNSMGLTVAGSPISYTTAAAPIAQVGAFRTTQPMLFQPVPVAKQSTLGGSAYSYEHWGPTDKFIDFEGGWAWDNQGGDFLDAALVRQGTTPWTTANLNAVSGNTAVFEYTGINVTSLVQYAQAHDRWLAVLLKMAPGSAAPRIIAGPLTPGGHNPPRIDVTYADATTAVLACRIVARTTGGSAIPQTTDGAGMDLPALLEFDRPTKAIASASLRFTVIAHWSGTVTTCEAYLLDPPLNTEPVTGSTGLAAQAGAFDAGITGLPGVLGAHRYLDGTVLTDFVSPTHHITSSASSYDPAIYQGGATDLTKLPHVDNGKFVSGTASDAGLWSLVNSSHTADGFAPLAPGVGALRVEMPDTGVATGDEQRNGGTTAAHRFIMLREAEYGLLDHIFVRYYVRFNTPYNPGPGDRKEVLRFGNSSWTDMAGKWGIAPEHVTSDGGVSGSSGGGKGWQMRHKWADCDAGMGGPNEGGITSGWHLFDYQNNNPVGYRYVNDPPQRESWGQLGGLGGTIYAGRWYCIETEVKLNRVDQPSGTGDGKFWTPDGELRVWVDGRKVYDRTGMVFRTLPLEGSAFDPGFLKSVREIGVKGLWFNWFHGGLTKSSFRRVMFVTGLAWAKSRIGPMKTVSATWPFTIPAANTIGTISTNTLNSLTVDANEQFSFRKVLGAWSGAAVSLIYSGATVTDFVYWMFGGGHGDTGNDGVYAYRGSTGQFYKALAPSAAVVARAFAPAPTTDTVHGEVIANRPDSQHTYTNLVGLDSTDSLGAVLVQSTGMAIGQVAITSQQAHIFDGATWSRWADIGPLNSGVFSAAVIKDTLRKRIYVYASDGGTAYQWIDYTNPSALWQIGAQSNRPSSWNSTTSISGVYDPVRDLHIIFHLGNIYAQPGANPTGAWTLLTVTGSANAFSGSAAFNLGLEYRSAADAFVHIDASTTPPTGVYVLTPPASNPLVNAWTRSRIAFSGVSAFTNASAAPQWENRFRYVEALDGMIVCPADAAAMELWKF